MQLKLTYPHVSVKITFRFSTSDLLLLYVVKYNQSCFIIKHAPHTTHLSVQSWILKNVLHVLISITNVYFNLIYFGNVFCFALAARN